MNTPVVKRPRLGAPGLLLAALLPLVMLFAPPGSAVAWLGGSAPAVAASLEGMLKIGTYEIGAFHSSNGARAFCLEPGAGAPLSQQLTPVRMAELPGYTYWVDDHWGWTGRVQASPVSGEALRQINWLLSEHGETADAEHAAVVQIAIWELRREGGTAAWLDGKHAYFRAHGRGDIVDTGIALAAEAKIRALAPGNVRPNGALRIEQSDEHGRGTVSYPAGTTELVIEGAEFVGGGSTRTITGGGAGSIAWGASLHEPKWERLQEVRVAGTWELPERSWPAEVIVHPSSRETEQRIGAGVSPVRGTHRGDFVAERTVIDSRFVPQITTAVPEFIVNKADGEFSDTVIVSASDTGGPWPSRQDGTGFFPLVADGVLYGPFTAPQPTSDVPPEWAPVALRATLLVDRGPGSYDVVAPERPLESGYYYWVWGISESAQTEETRASDLLEPGASFSDKFGVREEGQLVPTELRWETQLLKQWLEPGESTLHDRVRVSLVGGAWVHDERGSRIPARLRLTLYQSDTVPLRQPLPPVGARELGTVFIDAVSPDTWIDAPSFALPPGTTGWLTVRTCLVSADQPAEVRGFIAEWCDDYGVPEETAQFKTVLADTGMRGARAHLLQTVASLGVGGGGLLLLGRRMRDRGNLR